MATGYAKDTDASRLWLETLAGHSVGHQVGTLVVFGPRAAGAGGAFDEKTRKQLALAIA